MNHTEKAVELYTKKYHCAQAVFASYADELGLDVQTAFNIAASFGSGMRKGEVCGACTGALMVLGAKYAMGNTNKPYINELTTRFLDRFAKENGTYVCNKLLGYDISTLEGAEQARDKGLFTEFCPKMVASAAAILGQIIDEESENAKDYV